MKSTTGNPSVALDQQIAAATAYMEASNQGADGIRAVMHVLFNRLQFAPKYGSTIADICLRPWQFSCWNTSDPNRRRLATVDDTDPILSDCIATYDAVVAGSDDPTFGATHYIADGITPPSWVSQATQTVKIGSHTFYKDVP
ncbi:MAG: cell wall hydrolase [Patescibacteria group bacterium]|nr:cell wall hydrolase [Patescibacteria group bacterium]